MFEEEEYDWPPEYPAIDNEVVVAFRMFLRHVSEELIQESRNDIVRGIARALRRRDNNAIISLNADDRGIVRVHIELDHFVNQNINNVISVTNANCQVENHVIVGAINSYDTSDEQGAKDIEIIADSLAFVFCNADMPTKIAKEVVRTTYKGHKNTKEVREQKREYRDYLLGTIESNVRTLHQQIIDQCVPYIPYGSQ